MSITKYGTSVDQLAKTASERPGPKDDPRNHTTVPMPAMTQEQAEKIQAEERKKKGI